MKAPKPLTVRRFFEEARDRLSLSLAAGEPGLDRVIREPTVNRPGLLLAGFDQYFAKHRIQVMGNVEMHYLESLGEDTRRQRLADLLSKPIPGVVFCRGYHPDEVVRNLAEAAAVPVFNCPRVTMDFINQATLELEDYFAATDIVHGSMVDILGIGVLITGSPGIGKSECAIGLIERGYSLVADDATQIRLHAGRELIGTCPATGRHFMEVRGIGVVDVPAMFGIKGIRTEKRVDLVVTLQEWQPGMEIERVGERLQTMNLLGIPLPHMTIPVSPGRDAARLVEVAAFHMKLRILGYNPAVSLNEALIEAMKKPAAG